MDRKSVESTDLFDADDWIGDVKDVQNRLHAVSNPYRGNKRKMLIDLASVCREEGLQEKIEGGQVLDLFSGSAFCSYLFKSMGAAVWSNDLLAFSYLSAVSLVENSTVIPSKEQIRFILKNKPTDCGTRIRDNYVGVRFTEEEAETLDRWIRNLEIQHGDRPIAELVEFYNDIDYAVENLGEDFDPDSHRSAAHLFAQEAIMLLHFIVRTTDLGGRLNNGQVVARVDHRIENKGRTFIERNVRPYNLHFNNGLTSVATRMDAIDLLKQFDLSDLDLVYIDPPYGGDQSDYAKMYEFFEDYLGFSDIHNEWEKERFAKSKTYAESFDELLSLLPKQSPWIFSYNDSSWASGEEIKNQISKFDRSRVVMHEVDYEYQYRAKDNSAGTEYVIVAHP